MANALTLTPQLRSGRSRLILSVAAFSTALAVLATTSGHGAPALLLNRTPSEPPGVYIRAKETPRIGAIIAFKTPVAAFPYADRHMAYLHARPLLKAVAAGPGDKVCTVGAVLQINGVRRAPIQQIDREGRALPQWGGCRAMGPKELFVFSDRVPNSFDSRYYGPVQQDAVLGVYQLAAGF